MNVEQILVQIDALADQIDAIHDKIDTEFCKLNQLDPSVVDHLSDSHCSMRDALIKFQLSIMGYRVFRS